MIHTALSIAVVNKFSGTSKVQRDKWSRAFWKYMDKNPDAGEMLRGWQIAGCNPRNIAISIHRYVFGYLKNLNADRRKRKEKAKDILTTVVRSSHDPEELYRLYGQFDAANRIANEARLAKDALSRIDAAFSTKRIGFSRSWSDLAMIEGFVFEVTQQRPTAQELVSLIRAGRRAADQKVDSWESNPVNIYKGIKNFKQNNPLQSWLWTNPSKPL
jgi:hypothetical protein